MKIEDLTPEQRFQVSDLVSNEDMSKDAAIAKVCEEPFEAEVEEIDARPVKEDGYEDVVAVMPFDARQAPTESKQVCQVQYVQPHKLTIDEIKKYICPDATDAEAYTFMQLCNARGLNPFTKEAYLVKYKGQKTAATVIVGKDAFTKKAGQHPMFDGYEAGVIVQIDGELVRREGTFTVSDEEIVGGWAKVYRKDCVHPFMNEVSFREYVGMKKNNMNGKMEPNAMWTSKPGTMIRKVALVQSLREAFTEDLGGCYDSAEMGDVQ